MWNSDTYTKPVSVISYCRVQVKQGETVLTESGDVYETTITGGRLGMFVFGQQDVIWSRLEARCADRSVEIFVLLLYH